jgi:hypothetical protein
MKHIITAAIAAFFMLSLFTLTAYAEPTPAPDPNTPTGTEYPAEESGNPFTPAGSGTVTDYATDGDGKEFYTITTPDDTVFYLVIDRQRGAENVYFLNAVQEHNLLAYEDLAARAAAATDHYHDTADKLKQTEAAIKRNKDLKAAVVDYARIHPIFEAYKKQKYSNKYPAEHNADRQIYRAACQAMQELLQGGKLPKMDALKAEWQTLTAAKKGGYAEYRAAQNEFREVAAVKANIDHLLGITDERKNKERGC